VHYALAPRKVAARARVVAASGTAAALLPALLVVVLVAELGLASRPVALGIAAGLGALALLRALLEHRRAKRRLAAFAIEVEGEFLFLCTAQGKTRVAPGDIARVWEIAGAFGGLRVELSGNRSPARFDIPRGGEAFADLRAWLAARAPLARTPRRGRAVRIALAGAIVLGLFFVPFVVADARGSRLAVALVLLVAWAAMRAVGARA
jgi:hypothetical protein